MRAVSIIAEAGVNHNGSLELAQRLIDEAHAAGADAVKFQTFSSKRLVSRHAQKADYQKRAIGGDDSGQLAMLKQLELSAADFSKLFTHAARVGIEFLSTPFDEESLAMLVGLGVRRVKLGSGDLTNAIMLRGAARTGLPLLLSTGMATLGEIDDALAVVAAGYLEHHTGETVRASQALAVPEAQALLEERVTLFHCTTEYPAPVEQTNLLAMHTMRSAFGVRVGYSDHTEGIAVSLAAVALGAEVLEKHFTVDRTMPGPDHAASVEPRELGELVRGARAVQLALGRSAKRAGPAERRNVAAARRSLVAGTPIARGTVITASMLEAKRPGTGLSPMRIDEVVGRIADRDYDADDPIVI